MADLGLLSAFGGGSIGSAIVKLQLDNSKYKSDLAKAEGDTKAAASNMGGGLQRFSGVAKAGLAVAGAAVIKFAADSIAAYQESERVLAQLSIAVGENTEALEQQATALQNLTGFQDEQILSADTVLARFKLTREEIQETIPVVLDYARATGTDATSAAEAIGKALLGNTRALKAVGIDFTATGKRGKDLASIMGLLQDKVGGAAEAFGKTSSGQLAIAQAKFDDLQEQIGAQLIPVLTELLPVLTDLAETIAPVLTTALQEVTPMVQAFGDALALVTGNAPDTEDALRSVAAASLDFFVPGAHLGDLLRTDLAPATLEYTGTLRELKAAFGLLGPDVDRAGRKIHRFAGLSQDDLSDFKAGVVESVQVSIGQFESMNDAFSVTPAELKRQLGLAVRIARREQADLAAIFGDKSLTDKQKEALAEMPPEFRRAFVKAKGASKEELATTAVELKNLNSRNFQQITNKGKEDGKAGGQEVGRALVDGMVAGVKSGEGYVASAVRGVVAQAIQAAKEEAESQSPSKKMRRLGVDFVLGLVEGIKSEEDKVVSETEKMIDRAVEAADKRIRKLEDRLSDLRSKASEFRSSIAAGFDRFLDFSDAFGMSSFGGILSFGQSQLANARQFADVLDALRRQGATRGLLQQVAEGGTAFGQAVLQGGPAGIAELNEIFASIADIQGDESKGLTRDFFGEKIDRVLDRLDELHEIRRLLAQPQRLTVEARGQLTDFERWVLSIIANATMRRVPV